MTIHWIMIVIIIVAVVVIVIICNGSMYISSCLDLSCLVLSWVDKYYYCYYRHDVVWARVTLHHHIISYHIISHVLLFYLFCWFDLDSILFYSILLYFKLIRFDSTLFGWVRFTILFSIVSHINEWFVCICLSVRPSVCLSVDLYE